MARYFDHISDADELRKLYHKLAMQNHPDHGGDTATMQDINRQYEQAAERINRAAEGTPDGGDAFDADAFRAAVQAAVQFEDITLELVGRWLWATGNTYAHRDALKAAGYHWSKAHKAWQYHDREDDCRRGGKQTLDEIKDKYGCARIVSTAARPRILTA